MSATESYNLPVTEYLCTQFYYEPRYSHLSKFANVITSRKLGTRYLPESRVKPSAPLYEHMTTRSPVYREERETGKYNQPGTALETNYFFETQYFTSGRPEIPSWQNRLRSDIGALSADISSSVAEYKKIGDGFVTFVNTLRKIRRRVLGRADTPRLSIDDVASMHLAVHFGIKPVVGDFYQLLEKTMPLMEDPPVIKVSSQTGDSADTYRFSNPYHSEIKWKISSRAKTHVKLKNTLGNIDVGNPVEWAWELIPFSFVIDWAIPIGSYLSQFFALSNVDVVSPVSVTTVTKADIKTYRDPYPDGPYSSGYVIPATAKRSEYRRDIYSTIPLPAFPSFKPSISLLRVQHAAALLTLLRHSKNGKRIRRAVLNQYQKRLG